VHLFSVNIDFHEPVNALVVELPKSMDISELFERIYDSSHKSRLNLAQVIIIRPPVMWPLKLTYKNNRLVMRKKALRYKFLHSLLDKFKNTFERVIRKPVFILYSNNFEWNLSKNLNRYAENSAGHDFSDYSNSLFELIKEAEITHVLKKSKAHFPRIGNVKYMTPSGRHVDRFLRVGNIQYSRAAIDAIFFWLLPYLRGVDAIIADTWSISSIAFNISRILFSYEDKRNECCPVEMLTSYYRKGSDSQVDEVDELIKSLSRQLHSVGGASKPNILVLLSATLTGRLAVELRDRLERDVVAPVSCVFVTLFSLGEAIPSVTSVFSGERFRGAASPPRSGTQVVKIDPQLYFPAQFRVGTLQLRQNHTEPFKKFAETYSSGDLIRLHRDDPSGRHHAVWIDTLKLAGHDEFKSRLTCLVRTLRPIPVMIVHPGHDAGHLMAETVKAALQDGGQEISVSAHPSLLFGTFEEDVALSQQLKKVRSEEAIIVLDDALISGSTAQDYQANLRHLNFVGVIHYLFGLSRVEDKMVRERQEKGLKYRIPALRQVSIHNTVNFIEEVILPNWQKDKCPWCIEAEHYNEVELENGLRLKDEFLLSRREFVASSAPLGLKDDIFIHAGEDKLHLCDQSIFAEAGTPHSVVFATIASGIQILRSEGDKDGNALGDRNFPLVTLLDYIDYLRLTYSDTILRSCFLRAALASELVFPTEREEKRRIADSLNLLQSPDGHKRDIEYELLLAAALGKFDVPSFSGVIDKNKLTSLGLWNRIRDIFGENSADTWK
jgi:hypothetical protein